MKPYDPAFDIIDIKVKAPGEPDKDSVTTAEKMALSFNPVLRWFAANPRYGYMGLGIGDELHQFTRRKK